MKKLIFLFAFIMLISSVSALNYDNLFYYDFDENAGSVAENDANVGVTNLNTSGNWTAGFLGDSSFGGNGIGQLASNDSAELGLGANFTASFWFNANEYTGLSSGIISYLNSSDDGWLVSLGSTPGTLDVSIGTASGIQTFTTSTTLVSDRWYLGVLLYNGTGIDFYVNGTKEINQSIVAAIDVIESANFVIGKHSYLSGTGRWFNGSIDEVGIWNRTLLPVEVTQLYNNGVGVPFSPSNITVTLNAPDDAAQISVGDILFNATFVSSGIGLGDTLNATLNIWYTNGTLATTSFNESVNLLLNETIFNVSGLGAGSYEWNVQACGTDINCGSATLNRTFTNGFTEISQTWVNSTTEGQSERFEMNLSVVPGFSLSNATLRYNNTNYAGSINQINSTTYSVFTSIVIGGVTAQTNQTFLWLLDIDGVAFNSTSNEQTVNVISLDSCGANTRLFYNLTLRDEEDQTIIATPDNWTIEVDIDIYTPGVRVTPVAQFSANYTNINPAQVCINDNVLDESDFEVDAVFKYSASARETEFYNIRNFSLTNTTIPQVINLFDLKTADSQEFLITFKDDSFSPVNDAILTITRKYINEGVFKTVEQPITNVDGQAIAHLVIANAIYTIQVTKNGALLATFDNVVAFCADVTIGECTINLDAFSTGTDPSDFTSVNDLTYTMDFDSDARTIVVVFNIPSGGVSTVSLNGTLFDNRGNQTICDDQLISSSGTLTCNIPASFGNVSILAELNKDGDMINSAVYRIKIDAAEIFGGTGYIFLLLFYLTLPLMLITTGPGMIIGAIVGLIFGALFQIFTTNNILGVGSTIIWFIIAGGIIAWKVIKRE